MNIADYHIRRLRSFRGKTILHVGAHLAQEADRYERIGAKRVIWIEAAPDTYVQLRETLAARDPKRRSKLQRAFRLPPTEHVTINALAGAEEGGTVEFIRYDNDAADSIFPLSSGGKARFPHVAETGEVIQLPVRKLDNIIRDAGIEPSEIDLLVLDVQGAELLCLQGATEILEHVRCLETEVSTEPIFEGGVLFSELDAFLENHKFKCNSRVKRVPTAAIYVAAA